MLKKNIVAYVIEVTKYIFWQAVNPVYIAYIQISGHPIRKHMGSLMSTEKLVIITFSKVKVSILAKGNCLIKVRIYYVNLSISARFKTISANPGLFHSIFQPGFGFLR